jgi:hypothetical protein
MGKDKQPKKNLIEETWKNDPDIGKIREVALESKKKFDYSDEVPLYESIPKLSRDEILEKYIILNHLIENKDRMYIRHGINPFTPTIFKEHFDGMTGEDLEQLYRKYNQKYSLELHRMQNREIRRLSSWDLQAGRTGMKTCNAI